VLPSPPRTLRAFLVAGALALLAGCATVPPVQVPLADLPAAQQARARENLRVFNAVWDLVHRRHYDAALGGLDWKAAAATHAPRAAAAADDTALYEAINAMLAPLRDSHTRALAPRQAGERRQALRARIGFGLLKVEGEWIVSEVLPDSPAQEAGVRVGWVVVSRNRQPLGDGTRLYLDLSCDVAWEFRDAEDRLVALTATARPIPAGSRRIVRELADGVVYLRFDEFDRTDRRWLGEQLRRHRDAPGVVIDLRWNPGGETFSLGITIGEFFDRSVDCGTFISRSGVRRVQHSWQWGSAEYAGKVAILVDGATGSAAEIFAAVLQDHGRARVVGRRTAGAVLASRFHRLPDGGELQLSREDYVAPKGRRIEGAGIEPDIPVLRRLADFRAGRDADVEAALAALR